MSKKGGYIILDLKDAAITTDGSAVLIPGSYEQLEGNYRKPVLVSGLNLDSAELPDFYALFAVESTDFVATVYIGSDLVTITIDDDDKVAVATVS